MVEGAAGRPSAMERWRGRCTPALAQLTHVTQKALLGRYWDAVWLGDCLDICVGGECSLERISECVRWTAQGNREDESAFIGFDG